jgi:hypothetical protein
MKTFPGDQLYEFVQAQFERRRFVGLLYLIVSAYDESLDQMGITCDNCKPGNSLGCVDICVVLNGIIEAQAKWEEQCKQYIRKNYPELAEGYIGDIDHDGSWAFESLEEIDRDIKLYGRDLTY